MLQMKFAERETEQSTESQMLSTTQGCNFFFFGYAEDWRFLLPHALPISDIAFMVFFH